MSASPNIDFHFNDACFAMPSDADAAEAYAPRADTSEDDALKDAAQVADDTDDACGL